ncbi:hypothetical protein E4U42_004512, partial [Claviceps africana]
MVRVSSTISSVLVLLSGFIGLVSADDCNGWYQCKYAGGKHCCCIDAQKYETSDCPSACNGEAECIDRVVGDFRY